ncbi:iron-regulated protein [Sediminicola sp. YIK13]|uniref:ChaN family lipoprotein n=1 Tax=Sediminicola sp. YIK13 TaxID=1453352 RepID=UPI00072126A9|nr:ChaN family lipoprotein [Sediminicola sp. YIK13]ALM08217.1 iron-regulated protein [Sediminicola sp. YIK13]
MKKILFPILFLFVFTTTLSQHKPAYTIYNSKGKKVSYAKMVKELTSKDIILFGELHNNAIVHWLQYEIASELANSKPLVLGAEMFETDNQEPLNNYLKGAIDQKAFDTLARLWPNYKTDYAPLVNFAKERQLPFIATNIPRRYASMVYKKGFEFLDTLTLHEKAWIAPLPIPFVPELPGYQNILKMMGDHGTPQLVMAQAIKDATMAHFILKNYNSGTRLLHFNGAYHSNNYEGILWYLKQSAPTYLYASISTVSQESIDKLLPEHNGLADFIICVDSHMTNTY